MYQLTEKDLDIYMENIEGMVVIDITGKIVFLNDRCAKLFKVNRQDALGRHIKEIFPNTKMIEGLKNDSDASRMVFYNAELGVGVSVQMPIYIDGEKVGLIEYDTLQSSETFFEVYDGYCRFLNEEMGFNSRGGVKNHENNKHLNGLVGSSRAVIEMKEKIVMAASTNSTVIIKGETGTGKELVANAVHYLSGRKKKRLVKINAAAFPENLVESELFGYEKGAFTGALSAGKKGKFEQADHGTLFIDEINQMPMSVQPKLLRALEEKEIDKVGGNLSIPVDVRIIAATNEDLIDMVKRDKFREDLYYRINVFEITIPPLRERAEDLPELISHMILELNGSIGKNIKGINEETLSKLKKYSWPGNIRELRNKVEQAMHYCEDDMLTLKDFKLGGYGETEIIINQGENAGNNPIEEAKKRAEKEVIINTIHKFGNNKTKTAAYLGIARPLLYQKMQRLGIRE